MSAHRREERMKRIVEFLQNDPVSLKNVKASTKAYKDGKTTTQAQSNDYVRTHRPSSAQENSRAIVVKTQAAAEQVPEFAID